MRPWLPFYCLTTDHVVNGLVTSGAMMSHQNCPSQVDSITGTPLLLLFSITFHFTDSLEHIKLVSNPENNLPFTVFVYLKRHLVSTWCSSSVSGLFCVLWEDFLRFPSCFPLLSSWRDLCHRRGFYRDIYSSKQCLCKAVQRSVDKTLQPPSSIAPVHGDWHLWGGMFAIVVLSCQFWISVKLWQKILPFATIDGVCPWDEWCISKWRLFISSRNADILRTHSFIWLCVLSGSHSGQNCSNFIYSFLCFSETISQQGLWLSIVIQWQKAQEVL